MTPTLAALADPVRRQMVGLLLRGERSAGYLERACGIGQPTASKHLSVLRRAGLVKVRPDAQRRLYRLETAPLAELDAWLAPYRRFWSARLDALEDHLNQER